MNEKQRLERDIEYAARSYKNSDGGRWASAFYSARVVGHKPVVFGATKSLSDRMGVSVDTVENLAHSYELYAEFRACEHYRKVIRDIRKLPYIYYSYFRSLYKARLDYKLTLDQTFSLLMDIVLAEGSLKLGDLDQHIQDRYGDTRDWTYFAQKAQKEIHKTLQQPDLPKQVRKKLRGAYEVIGRRA